MNVGEGGIDIHTRPPAPSASHNRIVCVRLRVRV